MYQQFRARSTTTGRKSASRLVIFSNLIEKVPGWNPKASKVLILAHREELLYQAKRQISNFNPSLKVEIDQGKVFANIAADVIIASVQTLGKKNSARLDRYDPYLFKCIIIDEAHHSAAKTYRNIVEHFIPKEKEEGYIGPVIWGCSATLTRTDGLALNTVFDRIVYQKSFLEMFKEKWLSEIEAVVVKTVVSLDNVKLSRGDFEMKSLTDTINTKERNELIVDKYLELANNPSEEVRRSTLVFATNVDHVVQLNATFRSRGIDSRYIVGTSNASDRVMLIEGFKKLYFPVLINCGILTEGTDIPNIDCIIMARPTKSHVLFQQMIGRGVRLFKHKKNCLIVDFADSFVHRPKLMSLTTLLGLDPDSIEEKFTLKKQNVTEILQEIEDSEKIAKELAEKKEENFSLEALTKKLFDPYAIFKIRLNTIKENYHLFKNYSSSLFADIFTCGDHRLINLSSLSWVSHSKDKYVLSTQSLVFFIEATKPAVIGSEQNIRNKSNPNSPLDDKEDNNSETGNNYIAYYRIIRKFAALSPKGGGGDRFISKNIPIPLTSNSLELAFRGTDNFILSKLGYSSYKLYFRNQNWRQAQPSEKQMSYLSKLGVPHSLVNAHLRKSADMSNKLKKSKSIINDAERTFIELNTQSTSGNENIIPSSFDFDSIHVNSSKKSSSRNMPFNSAKILTDKLLSIENSQKLIKKEQSFYKKNKIPLPDLPENNDSTEESSDSEKLLLTKGSVANLITRHLYKEKPTKKQKVKIVSTI
ncbi:putative mitochondrial ATP-dependent helicase irc3 [Smittium culicis]|uniref:Putative mitochondrial ATP-dependent helicase irc3 n=1 Tax=Smittium culicis TaxID=133412 RepID=A0A1R1YMR3_9FUNG|nr:putative mitochondrial ATP-dependent helicase irc3 [Smittium culicis]